MVLNGWRKSMVMVDLGDEKCVQASCWLTKASALKADGCDSGRNELNGPPFFRH